MPSGLHVETFIVETPELLAKHPVISALTTDMFWPTPDFVKTGGRVTRIS